MVATKRFVAWNSWIAIAPGLFAASHQPRARLTEVEHVALVLFGPGIVLAAVRRAMHVHRSGTLGGRRQRSRTTGLGALDDDVRRRGRHALFVHAPQEAQGVARSVIRCSMQCRRVHATHHLVYSRRKSVRLGAGFRCRKPVQLVEEEATACTTTR
jgi:hypothetical protein